MRGAIPIEIPVPVDGWNVALPVHKLPPTALRDGRNMLLGLDGIYAPRTGYVALNEQPAGLPADPRIVQLIGFEDAAGVEQIVIASLTNWYNLQAGPPESWLELTGSFNSDKDTAVRLVVFGSVNNQTALYGINGKNNNPLSVWFAGTTSVNPVTNTNTLPGAFTAVAADDMDVIADRLVLVSTYETAGGQPGDHPDFVRWSAVIDGQNWPAGAWNPLAGIGNLRAVRASSRTTGVVYGDTGAFSMAGVPGDDAGAFVFDRIEGVTVPPIWPNALISIGGIHYYIGTDFHIWRCDGQNAQIISGPIDAGIKLGVGAPHLASPPEQRPVILFDETQQRVWFFVTFQGDDEAKGALPLDLPIPGCRNPLWEVPQVFPIGITAAGAVLEQIAPTWDFPGVHALTTLAAPVSATDTTIVLTSTAGFPPLSPYTPPLSANPDDPIPPGNPLGTICIAVPPFNQYDAATNSGELITYAGISGNTLTGCTRGMFGTTAAAAAAGAPVSCEITWDSAGFVWPNWNAIPDFNEPALYIGGVDGRVSRFGQSSMDNGEPIPYSALWGLISSPDATQELQVNTGEVYVDPLTEAELAACVVQILTTPYDSSPVGILNRSLTLNDKLSWQFRLDATIAIAAFKPGPFFQLSLNGQSRTGGLRYAGAFLYADPRQRPDRLQGVPGLSGGPTTQ